MKIKVTWWKSDFVCVLFEKNDTGQLLLLCFHDDDDDNGIEDYQ